MEIVNIDTANNEFKRFADEMFIDIDEEGMTEEELETFIGHKNKILKSICSGSLVVLETGEPKYMPVRSKNKDPLTFYEPTGADLAASDKRGKGQDCAKMYETMGSMTKTHASRFSNMALSDLKVCQAVAVLFLV